MKHTCVALLSIHSGVTHPGTYRGLMEKIPYFKELGVTAVELLPVQEFNEHQSQADSSADAPSTYNTGDMIPLFSRPPKLPTAVREVWANKSKNSGKWSEPFMGRASTNCRHAFFHTEPGRH